MGTVMAVAKWKRKSKSNHTSGGFKTAFHDIDTLGDGELDFETFSGICDPDGTSAAEVKKLFELVDADGGGTLDVNEMFKALKNNTEARELAKHFDGLHALLDNSKKKRRRRASVVKGNSARAMGGGKRKRRGSVARGRGLARKPTQYNLKKAAGPTADG